MRYTTVLFDADDTLLDFKRSEHAAIYKVLSELSLPCGEDIISTYSAINDSLWKLLEMGGITKNELKVERFRRLCDRFGFAVPPERMAEKYIYALADQSYTVNNSEAVTERLYSAGIRLFIITNGIKYIQTKRFNATALCPYFEDIFISEEIGAEKPSAKFFEEVASRINGYEPSKTLVVGDSLSSDIKGGIGAGLDTCWYNPKGKAKPSDMAITYEITELTQLFSILGV